VEPDTTAPVLAAQKKLLANLRKLLSQDDFPSVQQGLDLLTSVADPALIALFRDVPVVTSGFRRRWVPRGPARRGAARSPAGVRR
jgi:hypothetical protein